MRRVFMGLAASVVTVLGLAGFTNSARADHHEGNSEHREMHQGRDNDGHHGEGQWGNSERRDWHEGRDYDRYQGERQEWREHQDYGQYRNFYYPPSSGYYVPYGYTGYTPYGFGIQGAHFGIRLGN